MTEHTLCMITQLGRLCVAYVAVHPWLSGLLKDNMAVSLNFLVVDA